MFYAIANVQHLAGGGPDDYYLLGYAWPTKEEAERGLPPRLVEEFHIRRQAQGRRVKVHEEPVAERLLRWLTFGVRDHRNWWVTMEGKVIDPAALDPAQPEPVWAYETFQVDLQAEFQAVVEKTLRGQLAAGFSGDHTGDRSKPFFLKGSAVPQGRHSTALHGDGLELVLLRPVPKEVP